MTPDRSSEMDRVISCPASPTVVALVDMPESEDGIEGSQLHWQIADRAIRELGATPPEGGLPPPDVPKGYRLPQNALWMVDWALRHVRETIPSDWSLLVEVEMEHQFPRWKNKGHADIVGISPDGTEAIGIDWKSGRDPVDPAESNWQIFSYECLLKLTWDSLRKVTFQIGQPRVTEDDDVQRISTSVLEGDRLEAAPEVLNAARCAALDDATRLRTGKHCNYCVGCSCPAIIAEQKLMEMTLTPEILAKIKKTPDDAALGDFVIIAKRLDKPMKAAIELLHSRLDQTAIIISGSGATITREIQGGGYEIEKPLEFYQTAKQDLVTDERMARVFKPGMTRLTDELAEAFNVNRGGKGAVTAEGMVAARYKPFVKQQQKRMLRISG